MNLDELYSRVSETISSLDFGRIWPGFRPLKFALYDDEKCFYDGAYIEKNDDFCANTSISFQGEQIAIWKVVDDLPVPVLASKIVHEMFHGYQTVENWNCWADEMEALYRYQYNADNLSLKLRENELLLRILDHFDEASYQELLSHRKRRSERHPYEYAYESKVEEIEGTATYVEWMTLRQLDEQAAGNDAAYARSDNEAGAPVPHPNFLLLQRRTDGQRTGCFWRIFFQRSRTPHCLFHAENGLSVRRRFSGKRELLPEGFRRDHVV